MRSNNDIDSLYINEMTTAFIFLIDIYAENISHLKNDTVFSDLTSAATRILLSSLKDVPNSFKLSFCLKSIAWFNLQLALTVDRNAEGAAEIQNSAKDLLSKYSQQTF